MFEGFAEQMIHVGEASIMTRHRYGEGTPVLLLHGHPRTSATWHRVALLLAAAVMPVVCADLRGYGRSQGPEPISNHVPHSKRVAATDMIMAMRALGYDRFALVGHDRGSYVALRLALDHPEVVTWLSLLDCIPISEHLDRINERFATAWWHWFFFAQPEIPGRVSTQIPSRAIELIENEWGRELLWMVSLRWQANGRSSDVRGLPSRVDHRCGCEDRSIGRRLQMPVQVLWSLGDDLVDLYGDPRRIWRHWANDLGGAGIDAGRRMAEDAPEELANSLPGFAGEIASRSRL
jgi:haloacetate dehalogenase